jgi:hypothetical protein
MASERARAGERSALEGRVERERKQQQAKFKLRRVQTRQSSCVSEPAAVYLHALRKEIEGERCLMLLSIYSDK